MALSLPLAAPAVHSPTTPLLRQRRTKTPSSSSMRPPATVVISSRRPAISSSDNHTPKTSILNPILVSFFRLERRIDQREREREREGKRSKMMMLRRCIAGSSRRCHCSGGDSGRDEVICSSFHIFHWRLILSWGSMALIPIASEALPILMMCVLLSNLGAAITEVAKDALVAKYGQKNKINGLQSYAFMALAAGGVLANCLGGFLLLETPKPKSMDAWCNTFLRLFILKLEKKDYY
ncbi:putative MFS transporter superfamily, biopterin transporter family [Helianthus annuus]|nr:putative MFS transporter superfamily, biopterin transporter family [Helianthus annuus]KAJ0777175.1 putative MFS transporter superfamily, biopterin transporter family [Helianthus annuus]KAJ0939875.1 putative MFS transporter superfamily, biopterin transporter family [Helianthus annuus]